MCSRVIYVVYIFHLQDLYRYHVLYDISYLCELYMHFSCTICLNMQVICAYFIYDVYYHASYIDILFKYDIFYHASYIDVMFHDISYTCKI